MRTAGILDFSKRAPVWIDRQTERRPQPTEDATPALTDAIAALQLGDELVIASAAVLGSTRNAVLRAIEAIGKRGATLYDASATQSVTWHPDALTVIAFAERAESETRRRVTAKARERKVELGVTGGAPTRLQGQRLEQARERWADLSTSARQVAEEFEVGVRTLYRLFGPKGTPNFGRKGTDT